MTNVFLKGGVANTMPKRRWSKCIHNYKCMQRFFYNNIATFLTLLLPKYNFQNYKTFTLLKQQFVKNIVSKDLKYTYLYDIRIAFGHLLEINTRNPKKILASCISQQTTRGLVLGVRTDSFTTINIIN